MALLVRAQTLLEKANSILASVSQPAKQESLKLDIQKDILEEALETIEMRVYQYQGIVEIYNLNEKPHTGKTARIKPVPVINNLNEYSPRNVDLSNLVNYPPKLQPVPVKPIFLDLAWNHIEYPGRKPQTKVEEKAPAQAEEQKPAKRGWFGFGR